MKILQVIPFLAPQFGGSVKSTINLSIELIKRGHSLTIIASDYQVNTEFIDNLKKKGIDIIIFPCLLHLGLFLYTPSMKKWLDKETMKFDIIHMQSYRAYQNDLTRLYANKYSIPYIVQARGTVLPFFEKKNLKKLYDFMWGNKLLKDTTRVIALTETEKNQYIQMGISDKKIEIIPNGINIQEFNPLLRKGSFREKHSILTNKKILLSLGRLHKIKNIDLLILAFSKVVKKYKNVVLFVAGPDEGELDNLKKMVELLGLTSEIKFIGPLFSEEKIAAYNDADLFVLPSFYDAFPNTVIESLLCGTPVIVTKGCHISDLVERAGIVINQNTEELCKAIIALLSDDDLRDHLGKNGIKIIHEELSMEIIMNKIESLYYSLIKETIDFKDGFKVKHL